MHRNRIAKVERHLIAPDGQGRWSPDRHQQYVITMRIVIKILPMFPDEFQFKGGHRVSLFKALRYDSKP